MESTGCWCLLFALTVAASCTVWQRSSFIGLFHIVWD
jgi:hypothetical protein